MSAASSTCSTTPASIDNVFANGSGTTPVVVDAGGKKMIVVMTFSCGLVGYEVN